MFKVKKKREKTQRKLKMKEKTILLMTQTTKNHKKLL